MRNLVLVGLGGFLGSSLRYLASGWLQRLADKNLFALGTLGVNVLGCLVLGFLGGYSDRLGPLSQETRLFLCVGALGGFTTFSTFGYETMSMLRDGHMLHAIGNVGVSVVAGLFAVWLGYSMSSMAGG